MLAKRSIAVRRGAIFRRKHVRGLDKSMPQRWVLQGLLGAEVEIKRIIKNRKAACLQGVHLAVGHPRPARPGEHLGAGLTGPHVPVDTYMNRGNVTSTFITGLRHRKIRS